MEHTVFIEGVLVKSFSNSVWYDTATPFQYCVAELKQLKAIIESGSSLVIEGGGETYRIGNLEEYKRWMTSVFHGGFENWVF